MDGGIAPKLIMRFQDETFMKGFANKGRYKRLMSQMPVKVTMNEQTALVGMASSPLSPRVLHHQK